MLLLGSMVVVGVSLAVLVSDLRSDDGLLGLLVLGLPLLFQWPVVVLTALGMALANAWPTRGVDVQRRSP